MNSLHDNQLRHLEALGQSLWLDYIERDMLVNGELERLIRDDGISGVTSNPAIFEKAITQHAEYDKSIALLARRGLSAQDIFEELAVEDVCRAADLLRDVYETSCRRENCGRDGYVSLEVSPHLAYDTAATVAEAQRLWKRVGRPNLMIKVPATQAGLSAIRQLIAAGININVTLLFGVARYREVAESYLAGLEDRLANGGALDHVASVASFFLSRIDTLVDSFLDRDNRAQAPELRGGALRGQAAIACARLAYREYQELVRSARWQALAAHGACPQRLLWASTSTKDPAYDDVKYVEALIGPDTVNTLPPETLAAYRDHGNPSLLLKKQMKAARALPGQLAALGLELAAVSDELERQGVQKFIEPYDRLLAILARRATELVA
ncbi:MAG: transaldolase [Hydrogenophilales bacterium]|nr:transaldolase [Hydrogenophilales bacterium]